MGFPTVKADRAFSVTFDSHHMAIAEGQLLGGELARFLADTGTPVTVLDDGAELDVDKPVGKMNVKELKAHAEANSIALGDASKKPEILAAIEAHAAATAEAGDQGDGDQGDAGDGDEVEDDDADGTSPDGGSGESA